jgi:copper chaperone CopZ
MTTRTWSVPGVSCEHCKAAIEGELAKVPGVSTADVDVGAKTVTVTGDASDAAIVAAIDEAGYDVDNQAGGTAR